MTTNKPRATRNAQCTICSMPSDQQAVLERLFVGGASKESLSRRFNVSRFAVIRHTRNHLTDSRKSELMMGPIKVAELVNKAADESKSLLEYLGVMRSVLFSQFMAAAEAGDRHGVASVSQQLLASLRELGRITGEIRAMSTGISIVNNTLNVSAAAEFPVLEEGLRKVIQRHPDARDDILELMTVLEAASTPGQSGSRALIECEAIDAEEIETEGADVA
jgi:hypothetical protein